MLPVILRLTTRIEDWHPRESMGIPTMPYAYRDAYAQGYRWAFQGIDGYL